MNTGGVAAEDPVPDCSKGQGPSSNASHLHVVETGTDSRGERPLSQAAMDSKVILHPSIVISTVVSCEKDSH